MKYAAIIFDLDGTAMPSAMEAMPSQRICEVTKKYSSLNLCAATGRSWLHAGRVIKALGLEKPCIISGGAVIINPQTEEIIWQEEIDLATATQILQVARQYDYPSSYTSGLDTTNRVNAKQIEVSASINTFYILDIPLAELPSILEKLENIQGIKVSKVGSWNINIKDGVDLHITNVESTKEHAVKELCAILDVESADVAGVGDGLNDIHLFKAVGHKVAMGNAALELKEASDFVIGDVADDSLADFIIESFGAY